MRRIIVLFTAAALLLAFTGTAEAGKLKDRTQSRSSSTFNTVAADFGNESTGGHVEAYETADGSFVGFLQVQGSDVCDEGDPENPDDDRFVHFQMMTPEEGSEPIPADEFSIGKRNNAAYVAGAVHVWFDVNDECAETGEQGEAEVYVEVDLESDGTRIRDSQSSATRGPDASSSQSWTFSGNGAHGVVSLDGGDPFEAHGRIGTMKAMNSDRS